MNESNNCCSCACQYSTPPWWVTMGFIPPYGYQGPNQGGTPARPAPPNQPGTSGQPATPGQPTGGGQQSSGSNPLGSIINGVLGPLGGILGGLGL